MTNAEIDLHLDAVLRASGSALRHYTLAKSLDDMRAAMRNAMTRPCPAAEQLHFLLDRDATFSDGDATLRFATNDQAMAAVRLGREIAAGAAA